MKEKRDLVTQASPIIRPDVTGLRCLQLSVSLMSNLLDFLSFKPNSYGGIVFILNGEKGSG